MFQCWRRWVPGSIPGICPLRPLAGAGCVRSASAKKSGGCDPLQPSPLRVQHKPTFCEAPLHLPGWKTPLATHKTAHLRVRFHLRWELEAKCVWWDTPLGSGEGRGSNSSTPFQFLAFLDLILVFWVYEEDVLEQGHLFWNFYFWTFLKFSRIFSGSSKNSHYSPLFIHS